jgi:hypothetical protein
MSKLSQKPTLLSIMVDYHGEKTQVSETLLFESTSTHIHPESFTSLEYTPTSSRIFCANKLVQNRERTTDPRSRGISADRERAGRAGDVLHAEAVHLLHPLIHVDCKKGTELSDV